MPTENRSSNTEQMVSVPREWLALAVGAADGYDIEAAMIAGGKLRTLLAQPAAQHQGEPVAIVDESDDGLFIDFIYGKDGSPLRCGDKLYRHPPTSDGFSAGDMADQGAKAFGDGQRAAETLTFEFLHPDTQERHLLTVTHEEVADRMDDVLFEKLVGEQCRCETVGETNVLDCCCDEIAEQFELVKPS
ncbi:hypothetical protein ABE525_17455 [Pseudomonas wadenswilerensis]|uniref:hypothetical protein n=1 Tax=Pseudomonas wadenswilerensis TaxID=1785161 RepID=UPI00320ADE2C